MAIPSSAAAAALPSQEYFDETLLENEECFELSPDEAVRETIDQFRRQLGEPTSTANDEGVAADGGVPSPTSVAGSGSNNDGAAENDLGNIPASLSHLALSHPASDEGRRDRAAREGFKKSLALLDGRVKTDGTVNVDANATDDKDGEGVAQALSEIGRRCRLGDEGTGSSTSPLPFLAIFQQTSSIYTLMSFLGVVVPASVGDGTNLSERLEILSATARALSNILSDHPAKDDVPCARIRSELRDAFVPALGRLVCLLVGFANAITSARDTNTDAIPSLSSVLCDLLRLGTHATRGCEGGKVAFVQSPLPEDLTGGKGAKRGGVTAVVACLSLQSDDNIKIWTEACQLLASLCRYDDHRDPSAADGALGAAGVNASSAHDHAVTMQRAGAVPLLMAIARDALSNLEMESDEGGAHERLAAAVLTALRVLAINDEIIQTMVALGVLPIVTEAIRLCVPLDEEETAAEGDDTGGQLPRRQRLAAASLGLLRNLCGNDEMKSNLCLGSADRQSASSTPSVLPHLLRAMQIYASTAQIQEHACGTLAAMALRRPGNARAILDADGPRWVLTAMKQHPDSVNVQRQGALAVRNVVSRLLRELPEGVEGEASEGERTALRDAFLELGAEDVLRNNAGRHQGSVDEAYAALRDLGCAVSLVKFSAEDVHGPTSGASVGKTMMFGEKHNSNFRPVYEESAGLSEGVDSAVSQFGA